jgi:hypothetical protein
MSSPPNIQSQEFFESVRAILADARRSAYSRVNRVMIEAYWHIVDEEQKGASRAGYGESLLQGLSRALTEEFGGPTKLLYTFGAHSEMLTRQSQESEIPPIPLSLVGMPESKQLDVDDYKRHRGEKYI